LSLTPAANGGQTLIVRDTGPGIPKEEIPRVMQAFGQGSLAQHGAEGGTGLGLPIVQNLVALHGGTFELRSELRKGTEAIVTLPKSRMVQAVPPMQPLEGERHRWAAAETPQRRPHSLIAGDGASGAGPSTVAP
jgi:two-component system cell cycle sensor histidine kinase PleC